ncbi:SDR family oxidoreductase [Sphingorhabdus sp. SMR4y]|uniref:SDR family oxidoreductase n=1 Tax=Sphingorhabdus sp. SMR4y TaxID=2584094 RepID=UPI000B5C4313|nr:SDR family oxidoreductase [Sphingorhabdus sp. SMR4y]ASK88099.1 1,6-dihydroxycyclohexa-2,4-diene-1-carboxylate dehydrogenase [Sphingorhabdus sp. SMR4y]
MGRLQGKVAIITGAAKGLGEADARIFAREGATVILTDMDVENGKRVAAEIGDAAEFQLQDVRDERGWEDLIADVVSRHGRLDILVNNAGVVEPGTIETQTAEEYNFVMAVSADGAFYGCKYAVPAMKASGGGAIINMCSIASIIGEPIVVAYAMAKGAIESLTRSVAVHCANNKYNIRCNSVHPAGILTPMVEAIGPKVMGRDDLRPSSEGPAPSALGEPDDIANTVLFLASEESKFINGAAIRVDNAKSVVEGVVS